MSRQETTGKSLLLSACVRIKAYLEDIETGGDETIKLFWQEADREVFESIINESPDDLVRAIEEGFRREYGGLYNPHWRQRPQRPAKLTQAIIDYGRVFYENIYANDRSIEPLEEHEVQETAIGTPAEAYRKFEEIWQYKEVPEETEEEALQGLEDTEENE